MRVVVIAVDIAAVLDIAFQPMHGKVEAAEAAGFIRFFYAANRQLGCRIFLMLGHEAGRLHKHAARATGRIQNAAMEGLDDLRQQAHDAGWRIKLAAALALGHGEFAEEVFVNASESIVVKRGGDFGNLLEQLFEQGAGEEIEGFGQHASQRGVVLLNIAHGSVDLGANVGRLGQGEQVIKPRLGAEIEHALGLVSRRVIHPAATAGRAASGFQLGAQQGKPHFGKAQKDQAKNGA